MPEQNKELPASLTDPLLNTSRAYGARVDPSVLNNYSVNRQVQYQNKIGNPNGVLQGQPIFDLEKAYKELPKLIEQGASLIEEKTLSTAKTTVAKAAGVAALKQAEVITANNANKAIAAIINGTKTYLGKPALQFGTAAGLVSFTPLGFAKNVGKSIGLDVAGLTPVSKALTAAEVAAAATGTTKAYHALLEKGVHAIGGAIDSVAGGISRIASNTRLTTIGAAVAPIGMGDSTIDGWERRRREEQKQAFKQEYYPSSWNSDVDYDAFETANFERWKEQDDRNREKRIQEQRAANIQRINESMSSSGYKEDHVSAYFKNK